MYNYNHLQPYQRNLAAGLCPIYASGHPSYVLDPKKWLCYDAPQGI